MRVTPSLEELAQALLEILELHDLAPADIDPDAPLFAGQGPDAPLFAGQGPGAPQRLGLDSMDAVVLAAGIERRYGARIESAKDAASAFASLRSLATFIAAADRA